MGHFVRWTTTANARSLVNMGPGFLSPYDTLRLDFSGVTMRTTCITVTSPTVGTMHMKVTAGTLDGIYDLTTGTTPPANNACRFLLTPAVGDFTALRYSTGTCTTSTETYNVSRILVDQNAGAGYAYIHAELSFFGIFFITLFDARIPICEFVDGVVIPNNISSPGDYDPVNAVGWMAALGYGGDVTVSLVCP